MKIVGADVGKYQTRIVAGPMSMFVFPSRIIYFNDSNIQHDLGKNDFIVEFGGEKYYVGEFAKREGKMHIQYKDTSKVHYTTLINLLCGLYSTGDTHFKVVINTPIGNKSEKEIEELKKMVQGTHDITINGEKLSITIEDVGVWVEGAAGFFSQPLEGIVQGFDFGSTTTNVFYFDNKYFINSKSITVPYGIENARDIADNPKAFMESIYAQMANDFKVYHPTMVLGGGHKLMFEHVRKYYKKAFVADDPIFATAKGLYKLAVKQYGR